METFHDWWYNVTLVIKLQFLYNSRRKERSSKKKFAFRFVLWVSQKRLQYFLLFLLFSMQCWDFWFHVLLSHQWVVIICWWSVGVGIRWWSLGVGGGVIRWRGNLVSEWVCQTYDELQRYRTIQNITGLEAQLIGIHGMMQEWRIKLQTELGW